MNTLSFRLSKLSFPLSALFVGVVLCISTITQAQNTTSQAPATRVVIFPFETVNVPPELGAAAADVFATAMTNETFTVIDWKPVAASLDNQQQLKATQSTPATTATESPTNPQAVQATPSTNGSEAEAAATANVSSEDSGGAAAAPQNVATTPEAAATLSAPSPTHASKSFSDPSLLLNEDKEKLVTESGASYYIEGKIVRLGSKSTVAITMKTPTGEVVSQKNMKAANDDDLHLVLSRMAKALRENISTDQTQTLNNATLAETSFKPNRAIVQNYNGFILGGGPIFSEATNYGFVSGGYQGIWEIKRMRLGINILLNFASETDRFSASGGLAAAVYLNEKGVSPYVGGGAGIFLGDRVSKEENIEEGEYYYDDGSEPNIGFEAYPAFGVEFLRETKMRFFVETKYLFLIKADGSFGHGPTLSLGMAFY